MSENLGNRRQTVSFRDLKKLGEVNPGFLVIDVTPSHLYTVQRWIEPQKVLAALNREARSDDVYPTSGYVHRDIRGNLKLILGDGNTKAIIAWIRGKHVEFSIKEVLPFGTRYFPLSQLRSQYSDLFTGFEYQ